MVFKQIYNTIHPKHIVGKNCKQSKKWIILKRFIQKTHTHSNFPMNWIKIKKNVRTFVCTIWMLASILLLLLLFYCSLFSLLSTASLNHCAGVRVCAFAFARMSSHSLHKFVQCKQKAIVIYKLQIYEAFKLIDATTTKWFSNWLTALHLRMNKKQQQNQKRCKKN